MKRHWIAYGLNGEMSLLKNKTSDEAMKEAQALCGGLVDRIVPVLTRRQVEWLNRNLTPEQVADFKNLD